MPETPEQRARQQIDAQLAACGWVVQDYKQFNPSAGRGIALREAPLKSGTCDYLLLVDRKAVGIAEAKKEGTLLSGVAEQSAHYAANLPDFIQSIAPGSLPFLYESTGVETFFRDERDPEPRSRRVFSFHRPETLATLAHRTRDSARPPRGYADSPSVADAEPPRLSGRGHHESRTILCRRRSAGAHPDGHRRG